MTDRLTPPQLRDLADLIWSPDISPPKPPNNFYLVWSCLMEISEGLRNSAARREAEAKPVNVSQPVCHEPGGCIAPAACVQFGKCPQKPEAAPQGEREGPGSAGLLDKIDGLESDLSAKDKAAPAADDLVARLRDYSERSLTATFHAGFAQAADRIEAQAREIASWKAGVLDGEK